MEQLLELVEYMEFSRVVYSLDVSNWGRDELKTFAHDLNVTDMITDELLQALINKGRERGIEVVVWSDEENGHHFMSYSNNEKYVRIVEYKNITQHKSPDTLIVMEVPAFNDKLYGYDDIPAEREKTERYKKALPHHVYSIGRLGTYRYLAIGDCIENVWKLVREF